MNFEIDATQKIEASLCFATIVYLMIAGQPMAASGWFLALLYTHTIAGRDTDIAALNTENSALADAVKVITKIARRSSS